MPLHLLQIAKKLGHDAGKMAFDFQKKSFKVQKKGGAHNNLVTEADHACEELIIKTIRSNFPDHGIISEERETIQGSSEYKWIIDPIDGSNNFAHGLPLYAVSICVVKNGKPIIAVVDIPALGEHFWAKHGEGAFLNGKQILVSQRSELQEALISGSYTYDTDKYRDKSLELWAHFGKECRALRRLGSTVMELAYLAAGRLDAFWAYRYEPWDIAAGKLIIEEAGGTMTNMDGSKLNPKLKNMLATNSVLHSEMLSHIQKLGGDRV